MAPSAPSVSADGDLAVADVAYRWIDAIVDGYFPAVGAEWTEDREDVCDFRRAGRKILWRRSFGLRKQLLHAQDVFAAVAIANAPAAARLCPSRIYPVPYFQDVDDHTVPVIMSRRTATLPASAPDATSSIVLNDVSRPVKTTVVTVIDGQCA